MQQTGDKHGGSGRYRSRPQRDPDGLRIVAAVAEGRSSHGGVAGTGLSFRSLQSLGRDRLAQAQRYRDRPCRHHEAQGHPVADAGRPAGASRGQSRRARRTARRSLTIIWWSQPARISPSTKFRASGPTATPNRSATSITPRTPRQRLREARGQSGAGRDRRGSGRLLLRAGLRIRCSSWRPSCGGESFAIACR